MKEEQILVRITGQDRPGLTAAVMDILAKYDAYVLDIGYRYLMRGCKKRQLKMKS